MPYLNITPASIAKMTNGLTAELRALMGPQEMAELGRWVRKEIIDRTQAGIDSRGKAFKPYSTKRLYRSLASRPKPLGGLPTFKGKKRKGKTRRYDGGYAEYHQHSVTAAKSTTVSLTATMGMMRNILVRPYGRRGVRLSIPNTRENAKAYAHDMGSGNVPRRSWFNYGRTVAEERRLSEKVDSIATAKAKRRRAAK